VSGQDGKFRLIFHYLKFGVNDLQTSQSKKIGFISTFLKIYFGRGLPSLSSNDTITIKINIEKCKKNPTKIKIKLYKKKLNKKNLKNIYLFFNVYKNKIQTNAWPLVSTFFKKISLKVF